MGKRIRCAREKRGMSREELAAKLGCSAQSIWRWERGEVKPLRAFRRKLEEILDVRLEK